MAKRAQRFKPIPLRTTLLKVKSGTIDLEQGGDGVYLQFNCDCEDALPYCRARCCALPGIALDTAELLTGRFDYDDDCEPPALKRCADGYCVYNDRATKACTIYSRRPKTCQDFHCTRGSDVRGWRLTLARHADEEE